MQPTIRLSIPLLLIALCAGAGGCSALRGSSHRATFAGFCPESVAIARNPNRPITRHETYGATSGLAQAESSYFRAEQDERRRRDCCVDQFYRAATLSWNYLEESSGAPDDPCWGRVWQLYHVSLARLIVAGQRFQRLDPRGRLIVHAAAGATAVPIVHVGSPWLPSDFQSLEIATDGMSDPLKRAHRRPGVGVPVVVRRFTADGVPSSKFVRDRAAFAATVVLRAESNSERSYEGGGEAPVIEIYDPIRMTQADVGNKSMPLAADFTAPFGVIASQALDTSWTGFLNPDEVPPESLGLVFLEPYEPGKIPVVFVHGLLSDPTTWLDLANDLRACPDVAQNYQFWAFRYATGQAFVKSAAELRRDCVEAVRTCDPTCHDPALRRMVLIGHSMGGLVSKLQVTHSDMMLWSTISPYPPQSLCMDDPTRRAVYERMFFEPQPFVERVIFIGTPHGGSAFASRFAGRVGSMLIDSPEEDRRRVQQIKRDNPGMLEPMVRSGLPTSVDLLQPNNPVLTNVRLLRVSPRVHLHSIIGTGRPMLLSGPADGVVPVDSARHPGVDSELFVNTTHSELHRHQDTVHEVTRILKEHLRTP